MNIIYYLIPVAILFMVIGVVAFFWATKSEQFEDMEKQGLSILMDDMPSGNNQSTESKNDTSSNANDQANSHDKEPKGSL